MIKNQRIMRDKERLEYMKYGAIYRRLVQKRVASPADGSNVERHHILPRALGGNDDKENIVRLTAREHFIAHMLLAKMHGGPMWAALAYMSRCNTKSAQFVKINSILYEQIKKKDKEWRSFRYTGHGNPFKGKTFTPEQLKKLKGPRPSIVGKKNPCFGKKFPGRGEIIAEIRKYKSSRLNIDTTLKDRIDSFFFPDKTELKNLKRSYLRSESMKVAATQRNYAGESNPNHGNGTAISGKKNPMWGKKHSSASRKKISETAKKRISCPHCAREGNVANMKRWHFENCKHKESANAKG